MSMREQKLALVLIVAVGHIDERTTHIGELKEKLLFHFLEVPIGDLVLIGPSIERVGIELQTLDELLGEILIDEGHVIADAPALKDLLPAQAQALVPFGLGDHVVAIVVLL